LISLTENDAREVSMSSRITEVEGLLAVGLPAIFHPEPNRKDSPRYHAFIRGWQEGQYVFLELRMGTNRNLVFRQMDKCVVRFLRDGLACAFDAQLIDWQVSRQTPFFRVSWPKKISYISVRKHERIDVDLACTIHDEKGAEFHGALRDLSASGCGLLSFQAADPGARLKIAFELPDGSAVDDATAIVRSARSTPEGNFLGCEFDESEVEARQSCDFYVSTSLARSRKGAEESLSVLLIDPDERDEASKSLQREGYAVTKVDNVVDGFFRLRLVRPSALLVNYDVGPIHMNGIDVCRAVKYTRGLDTLPIFVFGGEGGNLKDEAIQAGAAAYFPELSDANGYAQVMAKFIPGDDIHSDSDDSEASDEAEPEDHE